MYDNTPYCGNAFTACDTDGGSSQTYSIGETGPKGVGMAFYVTDGSLHVLKVAPDNQNTSAA